ncbi:GIY-YIG nuclease family protein [Patescibacteria group bacterium]|nr:GIY-YIG nuclease family protein [Patescibacteria group bacterium]
MYYVYALKSRKKNYVYKGFAKNFSDRLKRHNSGREKTTKPYAPFDVLYVEKVENRNEARKRENFLKSEQGRKFLQKLMADLPKAGKRAWLP